MSKHQFTKCINCDEVFFDTNADKQPFFEIPEGKGFRELTTQEDEGGFFQGCPTCETDGCLTDVTDENELSLLK
jgi:hypothetical protein